MLPNVPVCFYSSYLDQMSNRSFDHSLIYTRLQNKLTVWLEGLLRPTALGGTAVTRTSLSYDPQHRDLDPKDPSNLTVVAKVSIRIQNYQT